MKNRLLFLIPFLLFFQCALAQEQLFLTATVTHQSYKSELLDHLPSYDLFRLDAHTLYQFAHSQQGQAFSLRLRFGALYDWDMELIPSKVHDDNFKFVGSNGEVVQVEKNITYKGHLKNDPSVEVCMTIGTHYIFGLIKDKEEHVFELVEKTPQHKANSLVTVYASNNVPIAHSGCRHLAEEDVTKYLPHPLQNIPPVRPSKNEQENMVPVTYCPRLSIVLDWQGLKKAGSVAAFNDYIQTIINIVNTYYDDEFGVNHILNDVYYIQNAPNPWPDVAVGDEKGLTENFAEWAYPNLIPNNYNCALLFTGTNMEGYGYAYIGNMCPGNAYRYGEIDYNYDQSITHRAKLTTHELGHLWGAEHASGEQYIMNPYVHDGNIGWNSTAFNVITSAVNTTFNSCLPSCSQLTVNWTSPVNGQIFNDFNPIPLSVTATANVPVLKVEFYVNNVLVGTDNTSPYSINWTPVSYGNYNLKAIAYDNSGTKNVRQIDIGVKDPAITELTIPLAASSDDAEHNTSNNGLSLTSTDLEITYDGSAPQQIGLRFANVNVPAGATLTNAYIQFTADRAGSAATTLNIYGHNIGNAPVFSSTNTVLNRTKTTNFVQWVPPAWINSDDAGTAQRTPNLTTVVQSIINRSDWAANNAMAFIISGSGTRAAYSYDGAAGKAAVLHLAYTLGPVPVANFTSDEIVVTPGRTVQFESAASGDNLTYQWTFEGGTPATSTAANPAVVFNTLGSYDVSLTVSNAYGTNTVSKADYITVDQVCSGTGAASTGNNYITQVTLGTIAKSSAKSSYSNYTALSASVEKGSTYTLTVTLQNATGSDAVYVWADWNGNKSLENNESVSMSAPNGSYQALGSLTVPLTAATGSVRLRIRSTGDSAGNNPCGDYAGEVEDYTLNITTPAPPAVPSGLTVTNITNSSATLNWSAAAGATGYTLQLRPTGGSWTAFNLSATSMSATALAPGTSYEWQVQAYNAIGTSAYSNTGNFTTCYTNCVPLAVSWTAPADGQVFNNLSPVTLSATANGDGGVAQVAFFVNGDSIAVVANAPYTTVWTPPAYGSYLLNVVCTGTLGLTTYKQIGIVVQDGVPLTLTAQVSAGSDDAEQNMSTGYVNLTSSDLELIADGSTQQQVGIRFRNINIPRGSTITQAYIQFNTDAVSSGTTNLQIYGENQGNPGTFINSTNNISTRVKTTTSVAWSPVPWTVIDEAGVNQRTPDLSSIVGGLVARSDWNPNNALVFVITGSGYRAADSYDGASAKAPKLHVSYISGSAPIAEFSADKTSVSPGTAVQFTSNAGGTASTYQWTFEGGTPANSTAANPSVTYTTPGIYSVTLTVGNASGSNTLTKTGYISVDYCSATARSGTGDDYIVKVAIGGVENASGKASYTYYPAVLRQVAKGSSYSIKVTLNSVFPSDYMYAWADWNNNKIFEAGESVTMSGFNAAKESTGTLNVPASATNGNVRLRVRNIYGTDGPQPCGTYWGEVEDYVLQIIELTTLGVPDSLKASSISAQSAVLSWTRVEGATSYEGQIRITGGSWIAFTSSTNSYTLQGLSADTTYQWQVRALNANTTGAYSAISVFSTAVAPTYCVSGSSNFTYEWISKVDVGSFSNPSGASGYSDFTGSVVNMTVGAAYILALTPGFSGSAYNEYWKVWVDLKGDGSFDAEDLLFDAGTLKSGVVNGTIAIPTGTSPVTTRMRVSMRYSGAASACSMFTYGEVEDYTVQMLPPSGGTLGIPTGLTATSLTISSATLGWNGVSGASGYAIQIRAQGESTWMNFTSTTNTYKAVGLIANKTYEWRVRATNATTSGSYSEAAVFTTLSFSPYCISGSSSTGNEWIAQVNIGTFSHSSGAAGYTDFTAQTISLQAGTTYPISLVPGFSGSAYYQYWKIWVDLDGNGIFSSGELLFDAGSTSKTTVSSTLSIPFSAIPQTTRLRVSMKYNSAAGACETFSDGEVEDYTVQITAGQGISYCTATVESILTYYYIKKVVLHTINTDNTLGNTSTGYSDYTSVSTNLTAGATYPVAMHFYPEWSGNSGKIYIDWNADGDFTDANETVLSRSGSGNPYTATLTVPANATNGPTRMRVRLAHYETIAPCGLHDYGEIEDYTVNIVPAANAPRNQPLEERGGALEQETGFEARLFPNPASNTCFLVLSGSQQADVRIVGTDGRMVRTLTAAAGTRTLPVEGLQPGLYFVQVTDQHTGREQVQKLVLRP
jgi:PKD repeat protein